MQTRRGGTPSANCVGDSPEVATSAGVPDVVGARRSRWPLSAGAAAKEGQLGEEVYYHSYFNRDRLVHIVDADLSTCEALSVLFRLEGFQTSFSSVFGCFFVAFVRWRVVVVVLFL